MAETKLDIGINVNKMLTTISDIDICNQKMVKTLELLRQTIEGTDSFFQGEVGDYFRNYFRAIQTNYKTIHDNILSYENDLNLAIQKYQRNATESANNIITDTTRIKQSIKEE